MGKRGEIGGFAGRTHTKETKQYIRELKRLPEYNKYMSVLRKLRVGEGFYTPEYWQHSYIQSSLAKALKIKLAYKVVYKDGEKYLLVIRIRKPRRKI